MSNKIDAPLARQDLEPLIDAVRSLFDPLQALLRTLDAKQAAPAAPSAAMHRDELRTALSALSHLLAEYDLAALGAMAALRQRMPASSLPALGALDESINKLDFAQARLQCEELIGDCA